MCKGRVKQEAPFSESRGEIHPNRGVRFGFHPELPKIEYSKVPFDLGRVKQSLFDSTYRSPITLLFRGEDADQTLGTDIAMSVRLVQAFYEGESNEPHLYERPEWYLRGIARFTGPTGERESANMHVYLTIEEPSNITAAVVQVVVDQDRLTYTTEERPTG